MKYIVTIGDREVAVEVPDGAGRAGMAVRVEGREVRITAAGPGMSAEVLAEGEDRRLAVTALPRAPGQRDGLIRLAAGRHVVDAAIATERDRLRALARPAGTPKGLRAAASTLPGVIRRVFLKPGDPVEEATPILTLEAMKMENEVLAEAKGRIKAIHVRPGQVVNAGDVLAEVEED